MWQPIDKYLARIRQNILKESDLINLHKEILAE